ncbi:MAG: DNA polymerase III subunit alpha [Bacteroidota bacterium]
MFTHLHTRSWFSFRRGGSSPEALVNTAASLGMRSLALTDVGGMYGAVRFGDACAEQGIEPIYGAEITVEGAPIVLLAGSKEGYANVCALASRAHRRDRELPEATLEEAAALSADVWCLTHTSEGLLWDALDAGRAASATRWVGALKEVYGARLSVEVANDLRPGARRRIARLHRISDLTGVPLVATGDVRYATPQEYSRYDLLTCARLGGTVFDPHRERPANAEQALLSEAALRRRLPIEAAFQRAEAVAEACRGVDLIRGEITPPAAQLPPGVSARRHLRQLCNRGLALRYGSPAPSDAVEQLERELAVIADLDLDEFFLVVAEVVMEARRRGIRCAGRGSAANSLVAYLLQITNVDPVRHRLLFERFLHRGRSGTPDIDVDFDTDRRDEVIEWMEQRFGHDHTAMAATIVTYGLRSALRDSAKALGWGMDDVNALGKAVPPSRHAAAARDASASIQSVLGAGPLTERLVECAASLEGCPRHLGLHSGGMVLSRRPLHELTPVQRSANGVTMVQFDKDDLERLGLVKLDVLGLRMLATLSETEELLQRHGGPDLDLDGLPLDDDGTFRLIRASETLGTFQIESQGQLHLLAQHQPETFNDLVAEVSLFRPGPLQGQMVHPYVRRRRGREPVRYDHPLLEPILSDTYGVILYQEQVLEVAHGFAGMPLEEADRFRRLMSKFRDPGEMEGMRESFVRGARLRGVPRDVADSVFEKVSKFVGYGFCRSHAAAFALTVYQSCYLKAHHTAAYMAAVMERRPGMYGLQTLQEDARRFGVETLPPCGIRSGVRYDLESRDGSWAIRMPLKAVRGWSAEDARTFVLERARGPFADLEDLWRRVPLGVSELRSLAQAGGFDVFVGDARHALAELGVLERRLGPPGCGRPAELFHTTAVHVGDLPPLPSLPESERLAWDLSIQGAARRHPMTLARRTLQDLEIRPIATVRQLAGATGGRRPGPRVTVAGLATMRQRPPTANGVMFLTLEDESGFVQCVIRPEVLEAYDHVFRSSAVIVRGRATGQAGWAGLEVMDAWPLSGVMGGYEGHPSWSGGRDHRVLRSTPVSVPSEAPWTTPTP